MHFGLLLLQVIRGGDYHWARAASPFTLKLGDNLSNNWDPYLTTTSNEWNTSTVLDTNIVTGNTRPTNGQVEICNARYGNNGWLGIAQVWITETIAPSAQNVWPDFDIKKVILMALVHDDQEIIMGDIQA